MLTGKWGTVKEQTKASHLHAERAAEVQIDLEPASRVTTRPLHGVRPVIGVVIRIIIGDSDYKLAHLV